MCDWLLIGSVCEKNCAVPPSARADRAQARRSTKQEQKIIWHFSAYKSSLRFLFAEREFSFRPLSSFVIVRFCDPPPLPHPSIPVLLTRYHFYLSLFHPASLSHSFLLSSHSSYFFTSDCLSFCDFRHKVAMLQMSDGIAQCIR